MAKKKQSLSITITNSKDKPDIYQVNINRLAQVTGYDKSHVSRVFSQKVNASVECLTIIGKAMGIGIEELISAIEEGRVNVKKLRE